MWDESAFLWVLYISQDTSSKVVNLIQPLLHLPVIQEEAILEENVQDEIDESLNSHAEQVLPNKVPVIGIWTVVLP